jgi:hypothetical protein
MKITDSDYNFLKDQLSKLPRDLLLTHKESLRSDPRVKDLDTRFAWDLLYGIEQDVRNTFMQRLYKYCDDTHIGTALKRIVKELNL